MLHSLTADNDALLHTQLWIDPMEEFVHYSHSGDPVDITFGVKELKVLVGPHLWINSIFFFFGMLLF